MTPTQTKCTIIGEIPQNHHAFALFDLWEMGRFMTPVTFQDMDSWNLERYLKPKHKSIGWYVKACQGMSRPLFICSQQKVSASSLCYDSKSRYQWTNKFWDHVESSNHPFFRINHFELFPKIVGGFNPRQKIFLSSEWTCFSSRKCFTHHLVPIWVYVHLHPQKTNIHVDPPKEQWSSNILRISFSREVHFQVNHVRFRRCTPHKTNTSNGKTTRLEDLSPNKETWCFFPFVMLVFLRSYSWWFQPIWKILVKMIQNGNLPQIGVKIKHICNHHPVFLSSWGRPVSESSELMLHDESNKRRKVRPVTGYQRKIDSLLGGASLLKIMFKQIPKIALITYFFENWVPLKKKRIFVFIKLILRTTSRRSQKWLLTNSSAGGFCPFSFGPFYFGLTFRRYVSDMLPCILMVVHNHHISTLLGKYITWSNWYVIQ